MSEYIQKNHTEINKILVKMISQLRFFHDILMQADETAVQTHLSLIGSQLEELCKLTGTSVEQVQQTKSLHERLQQYASRIHDLESQNALPHLTEVHSYMSKLEDIFRTWYSAMGFRYASLEFTPYGIIASFSSELGNSPTRVQDQLLFTNFVDRFPTLRSIPGICIRKEPGSINRCNLIDTPETRAGLQQLFTKAFPHARVVEWKSREDYDLWLLRFKLSVPYVDIARLLPADQPEAEKGSPEYSPEAEPELAL